MEIRACDSCGARVSDLEIERGEAVESAGQLYCAQCAARLGIEPEEDYSHEGRAYARRSARAPSAGTNARLLGGAVAAGVALATIVGLYFLRGEDEALPPAVPAVGPPPAPPAPVPTEEPRIGRAALPEKPILPPPHGAGEPPPTESFLVAGFEEEGYAFECGAAAAAEVSNDGPARGHGALRLLKRRGSTAKAEAHVRVTLPTRVDLSGYNKLGLWLRSSGAANEFKLGLITSGRQGFVPAARDTVLSEDWAWFEFLLAGERSSVEGLVFCFNEGAEPESYRVYVDEVRAYEEARTVAVAPPTAEPVKTSSLPPPGGRHVYSYDFDGAKPAQWDLGELIAPGKGGAGGCLKGVTHGGGFKRLRLRFEPYPKAESGMFASFACRVENCNSFWVQVYDSTKTRNVMKKFRGVTPGEWRSVRIRFTDLVFTEGEGRCEAGDEIHSFSIFASGRDPDRAVYVDEFVIAVEEPRLVVADLEDGLGKATSKYGHAIADSNKAARAGEKGLAITVKPTDGRDTASRVEFPVPESDLSRFTHVSVWLGGKGFARLKGMLAIKTRAGNYERIEHLHYGPEWKRYVFELKPEDMSDVELVAFYFSNADDWPESFEVYLDELALSVGPPGPEEPAPSAAAEEPKAAPPPARLDLTGGGEVLFAHDFEDGAGAFKGGKTTSTDTYRSSRASFKATPDLNDRYFSCTIAFDQWSAGKPKAKGIFEVGKDTVLAFAYYLDGDEDLTLIGWVPAKHKNFSLTLKGPQRTWNLKQVRLLDFHVHPSGTDPRLESGDWFQEFRWLAGKPGERCTLIIDDVVFCNGPLPGDVGESLRRKFDKKRETEADPRKDGFYMTAGMVDGLAERLKESKGAEKTLAVLGDRLAASNFFLAPLAKAGGRLDPKKGYRFIPKAALAGSAKSLYSYRKRDSLKRALEKYKPEVVVVLVGQNDLRKGVPADEAETEYSYICECCLEAGAVPVLFAVPVKADVRTPLGGLASAYAAAAFKTAKTLQVPMIDAHSRLNAVGKSPRRYFSSTGLRQPAYDELNALFIEVYDRLERYVFARTD